MKLPEPRGELSAAVVDLLAGTSKVLPEVDHDPYGEDLQLALHTAYELHYRGFHKVDPEWEWDPDLLRTRREMERLFLKALKEDVPGGADIDEVLAQLLVEPVDGGGISHFLKDQGEWWHVREYFVHRSIYHHKEADPHIWVVPRLQGRAKAALVAVEFDEFGGGRAERLHSQLYVDLLAGAGLETGYLHYLNEVPAQMLAVVNLMSMFGLHRALRGALVGHFAAAEITTAPSSQRMVKALSRFDADEACVHFYTEHMEADAVHEQVMRRDVIGDLLDREPELTESVVFGVQATELLEGRFGERVLSSWRDGRSSLHRRT
ncbi:iron-containing redox enzyme family protein [Kibdelosporangium philippinense]|uniref:Iron-containing redox enzyme family protein n=1 Tax=Kibdelosporangium philippinense TaxID=211113 RepID=A0ABS8ZAC7_9PSEU|nr:iron-containing redox enzyme family protein [Kibdelosporangium philippinense]MCE7004831.1 iron-containing redox enzyme family protein [Kibdelosporangium philippinense]